LKQNGKDPPRVVIDEFVGMWISLIALPKGWLPLITGFGLFRLFDITKVLESGNAKASGRMGLLWPMISWPVFITNLLLQINFQVNSGTLIF